MFNLTFNAAQVPPNLGSEPIPSGIYTVAIVKSDEKPVSGKPGCYYYQFDMQVQEGDFKGKMIIERLNCKNDNQQAVDIAYGTLSAICHVAGVEQIGNSSAELHNRPFKVNVIKQPRSDDPTKEENRIRGYLDMAGNPPKAGSPQGNGQASASQAAAFAQQPQGNGQTAPVATAPAPAPAPVAPTGTTFPPEGWVAHPSAPGYFYKGQEVLTEAQLRAKVAPAPAPVAPAVPQAPAPTAAAGAVPVVPSWAT